MLEKQYNNFYAESQSSFSAVLLLPGYSGEGLVRGGGQE